MCFFSGAQTSFRNESELGDASSASVVLPTTLWSRPGPMVGLKENPGASLPVGRTSVAGAFSPNN